MIDEIPFIIDLGNGFNPLVSGPVISYRTNPPYCTILDNLVFENVKLAD